MKNYYHTLGIEPTASKEEIREAYRKLSKKVHPDMNSGDEFFTELFKNIDEAYQVLANDRQRSAYNFQLDNYSADYNFLKEKERELKNKEAMIIHRKLRRKLLVKGSVSLISGLAVIALFSLSFDERNEPEIILPDSKSNKNITVYASDKIDSSTKIIQTPTSAAKSMKQIFDEREPVGLTPVVKVETVQKKPGKIMLKKVTVKHYAKHLSDEDMSGIIRLIERDKILSNNSSKSVRILRSAESNVENAFDLAGFLQNRGFVIAGRETTPKTISGIDINCRTNCIIVTIGIME